MNNSTTTRTSLNIDLSNVARGNGWTVTVDSSWSWWGRTFTRGEQSISIRERGNRLTDVAIRDGSGVIYSPKKNKKAELLEALESKEA